MLTVAGMWLFAIYALLQTMDWQVFAFHSSKIPFVTKVSSEKLCLLKMQRGDVSERDMIELLQDTLENDIIQENRYDLRSKAPKTFENILNFQKELTTWTIAEPDRFPTSQEWNNLITNPQLQSNAVFPSAETLYHFFHWSIAKEFRYSETRFDIFQLSKEKRRQGELEFIEEICARMPEFMDMEAPDALRSFLIASLYSGQRGLNTFSAVMDSSASVSTKVPVKKHKAFLNALDAFEKSIFSNDIDRVVAQLMKYVGDDVKATSKLAEIHLVPGQSGRSLVSDLLLVHIILLIASDKVRIVMHSAALPTKGDNVPTSNDIMSYIQYLSDPTTSDVWHVRHVGESMKRYINDGSLKIHGSSFWVRDYRTL